MRRSLSLSCLGGLLMMLGVLSGHSCGQAPQPEARRDRERLQQPVYKVAQQLIDPALGVKSEVKAQEHPLAPALAMSKSCQQTLSKVRDYSATMVKRERIGGKLN